MTNWRTTGALAVATALAVLAPTAVAQADNRRLNSSVISNVYTVKIQAGCTTGLTSNPKLQLAAEWFARDLMAHRDLEANVGSDGSTVADRARAAGFQGEVAQTVATNPALAINGLDILNQWYYDPVAVGIMRDCAHTQIGVWSENALDFSDVVAVYGAPARQSIRLR